MTDIENHNTNLIVENGSGNTRIICHTCGFNENSDGKGRAARRRHEKAADDLAKVMDINPERGHASEASAPSLIDNFMARSPQ